MNTVCSPRITHSIGVRHARVPQHPIPLLYTDIRPQRISIRPTGRSNQSKASYSSNSRPSIKKERGRLYGRTALITGGSSGIGYAIAERFLAEGASRIVLVGRRREKLQDASKRLSESIIKRINQFGHVNGEIATRAPEEDVSERTTSSGQDVDILVGDISVASEWMTDLEKAMIDVDILINAAGISISNILPRTSPDHISGMLKTNLEGAIYTSRAMLKSCMRARSREKNRKLNDTEQSHQKISKSIINISSLLALKGVTGTVTYAASKAGILGLTRSMAVEAADILKVSNVMLRCNAILPGYIDTPMIQDFSVDKVNELRAQIPLNRFGDPREVADAAVFLSTNGYANNCVLNLDGGLSAV
ncbi:3-oxoacyl-acyl carrier protein reductase [Talaromyces stipitatus ATCC 10500]|uniref:3-oxoacyl-acyl carrier protein reductase n=1 Tax=Talaromyces stipitatus (strain ATCC 10500 / CBS 375.48 / QM 6759 / NRRL 1006) TaxID=441959 RepID=B8MQ73_TALSN|nr:3-oxoacyl-acyl carrier protein reductase [Talaromyces stipitatus ATCC 10500]EED13142.1 3-oxoacyl-acyl carrier protein reductase [Talaromyces stipitatus ATCC 10500]